MAGSEIAKLPNDVCEDCGAVVPQGKAGCLRIFEEVLVKDYSDYRYGKNHRLTVDAYSLQHPDAYMRSGKSFGAHLTGMCAALEHEDNLPINQAVQRWLNGPRIIDKPAQLPKRRGELTIMHIHSAANAEEHNERVREWARSVWDAWAEHHGLARRWISEASAEFNKQ
jgi:hypothetical protein